MIIEEGLAAHLLADAAVITLVGDRINPQLGEQGEGLAFLTYMRVGSQRIGSFDGPCGMTKTRLQINCFATGYLAAKDIAEAVRRSLDNFKGLMGTVDVRAVSLLNDQDQFDEHSKDHWVAMTFSFLHKED